jgi:RsiW-degrading membrane proteinase PrsW (M82 family)
MQCTACQFHLDPSDRFCSACGAALSATLLPKPVLEERSAGILGRVIAEFRSTPREWFLPLRAWRADRFWDVVWVKWLLYFAVFPIAVMLYLVHSASGAGAGIAFLALYFGSFWVFLLRACLQPRDVEAFAVVKVAGFTAVIGIALVLLLQGFPVARDFYDGLDSRSTLTRLCGFVFGVGVVEETVKALPIFLFVFRARAQFDPAGYAYLGAISGLAFGVIEAIGYSQTYLVGNTIGSLPAEAYLVVQVLRFISLPLLHASWTGFAAVFMGAAMQRRASSFALIAFGLAVPIVLHGVYDTFDDFAQLATAAATVLLFVAYTRARSRAAEVAVAPRSAASVLAELPTVVGDLEQSVRASTVGLPRGSRA